MKRFLISTLLMSIFINCAFAQSILDTTYKSALIQQTESLNNMVFLNLRFKNMLKDCSLSNEDKQAIIHYNEQMDSMLQVLENTMGLNSKNKVYS